MGNYFSNLYIKRNIQTTSEAIAAALTAYFAAHGMVSCSAEEADFSILLDYTQNQSWIGVYCEGWEYEDLFSVAPQLSSQYHTDVLSCACFDSDYMFLHLLNVEDGLDAFVNIGKTDEIKPPRRNSLAAWKTRVKDFDAFKQAVKQSYICAEDFLLCMQEQIALPAQLCSSEDSLTRLYFSAPQDKKPALPRLQFFTSSLLPCKPGKPEYWPVLNAGGASRGIHVLFLGSYLENDEISFDNVSLCYENARGEQINKPMTLQKIMLEGGIPALCASDPDFKIPAAPSPDLPPMVLTKKNFARSFGIRFTPSGNVRKFLDITVAFVPFANPVQGQCSWRVWGRHHTKKEYIEAYNRSSQQDHELYGVPPQLIDPATYDLD